FSGISDGIRLCFSSTPIRSLIFGGFLIGIGGGAWTTLLPEIGRDQIGFGPGYTSLLAALVSVGMISSTLFIATRRLFNNKTVYFLISVNCFGPGLIFLGFTQEPIWAFTYMFISGLYAGVFLTTQRTLLQENAPSDFVARIMSLNVFVNAGTVPISTGIIWILRHMFSSGETLAIFGLAVTLLSLLLTLSRKSTWDRHFDA
ncbi:MAG TPA: MFS transporter, partial [Dehalococcoidia bacterium]|nr:MFS transporter [Dehalococcoidia bacterium]